MKRENEFNFANGFKWYGSNSDQKWIAINYSGAVDKICRYVFCNGVSQKPGVNNIAEIEVSDVIINNVSIKSKLGI